MIELTGTHSFAAPLELVWDMSLDPLVLANIIPGCEKLEKVGDGEYEGQMKIRVGPVEGVFLGKVTLSGLQPPQRYHLTVSGHGPSGIVNGEGNVQLTAAEDGTTMQYDGQAQVSGRIATVGQRLMLSSSRAIVRQSLQNLDKQIQARLHPEATSSVATETAAPSAEGGATPPLLAPPTQTEFLWGTAQEMAAEFVPNPQHRKLLGGLAALVLLWGLLDWFANRVARRTAEILREER